MFRLEEEEEEEGEEEGEEGQEGEEGEEIQDRDDEDNDETEIETSPVATSPLLQPSSSSPPPPPLHNIDSVRGKSSRVARTSPSFVLEQTFYF